MWIVCDAAVLAAVFSACLGDVHQATHCHGFQTVIHSLSRLVVLFVDLEVYYLGHINKFPCNVM